MLSALLGHILSSDFREDSLACLDSAWVYPHAADPTQDQFIRVWGTPEEAFETPGPGSFATSFSLLKFPALPSGSGEPQSAKLVLWQTANPAYDAKDAVDFPIEARIAPGGWSADQWRFADAAKFMPAKGAEAILGRSKAADWVQDKPVRFEIELKASALEGKDPIVLALTSRLDPETAGEGHIYKLSGKYAEDQKLRPVLLVTWKPVNKQ